MNLEALNDGLTITTIAPSNQQSTIFASPFKFVDPLSIRPRQWLYGHFLMRGIVSSIIAAGGLGKSSLTLTIALELVSGEQILHDKVYGKKKVWLWNGEDPIEELQRRIIGACKFHSLKEVDLCGGLFVNSGIEMPIIIAQTEKGKKAVVDTIAVSQIIDTIKTNSIDCVVIDPFISSHRVEENDNGAIDLVVKTWARIAFEANCGVLLVHHSGKTGGNAANAESSRGASSFLGALRAAWVLNPMSKDEAEKANIENQYSFVSIANAKANLAPREAKAKWFEIKSVDIGNGGEFGGDFVGVTATWKWPDPFEDISVDDLRKCQDAIAKGKWRDNPQSKDWVGSIIGQVLGLDIENKADKSKVFGLQKTWLANGALKKVEGYDERRVKRDFVEVGERN